MKDALWLEHEIQESSELIRCHRVQLQGVRIVIFTSDRQGVTVLKHLTESGKDGEWHAKVGRPNLGRHLG